MGRKESQKGDEVVLTMSSGQGASEVEQKKDVGSQQQEFRLYKMRFAGCFALAVLNIVCAMNWVLFSTIAIDTGEHFGINLTKVNWLANIVCAMYLVSAPVVPVLVRRISIRGITFAAAGLLLVGSWMRYAATASYFHDRPSGAYGLLFMGSVLVGIAQCWLQVVPPAYSELWFNLKGRTTCTMILSIANPVGGAIGDLVAPIIVTSPPDLPKLLLIIGILSSAVAPLSLFVLRRPRTPPTRSAAGRDELEGGAVEIEWKGMMELVGLGDATGEKRITVRERLDFWLIAFLFAVIVGFFDAFLTLTNQIFNPVGYDENQAGYIGAAIIVSGLISAIVTAPLFDRFFHFRLALAAKILIPISGISFFAFIWAVKPHSLAGIFVLSVIMGISSFPLLPIALELAAEVVYNSGVGAPTTSAILYLLANGFSVVTVVGMNALQGGPDASPPLNMRKALIFEGVFVFVASFFSLLLKGEQARKRLDVGKK
ncbi:MFS general substrate transporter [Meredithblackwellia eburnea MCA 4105]